MDYQYLKYERRQEWRRLAKSLVPAFLLMLGRRIIYDRRYPCAFVSGDSRIAPGAVIGAQCIIRDTMAGPTVSVGDFTTTGAGCRFFGRGAIRVGKFCSVAPECLAWSENHNTTSLSAYPFETVLRGRAETYDEYIGGDITIGNDVWIGQRSIILAGAEIGDGCIVAAGSVVPRGTYPPYSVIGGVPAKIIKPRFDRETTARLLEQRWWDRNPGEIFGPIMDGLHTRGKHTA